MKKIFLIVDSEFKQFYRSHKIFYLLLSIAILMAANILLTYLFDKDMLFGNLMVFNTYKTFTQLIVIGLIGILAPSIAKEFQDKTWGFYSTKNLKIHQILLGKYLFYILFICTTVSIAFTLCTWLIHLTLVTDIQIPVFLFILLLLNIVLIFVTTLEISISALFPKTAKASLMIVICWVSGSLLNVGTPFLKGYLAPYDGYSVQMNIVGNLLNLSSAGFSQLQNPLAISEGLTKFLAISIPIILSLAMCMTVVVIFRKRDKKITSNKKD